MKIDSNYGREITSVNSAKAELWKQPDDYDPLEHLGTLPGGEFWGVNIDNDKAVMIDKEATNHVLLCGITRSGKGVFAGVKAVEAIKEGKGLIYIDVKQEEYTPQVLIEELERQNRQDDFLLVSYPNDFGYNGFNKDDSIHQVYEKILEALDLRAKADSSGSSYYQSIEKMVLFKVLQVGYKTHFSADWNELLGFIEALIRDFEALFDYKKEMSSHKPDYNHLKSLKTAFDKEFLYGLNFRQKQIEALETLSIRLFELIGGATIYSKVSLNEALYNGKVLYIKADMLNPSSLQFLKVLFIDLAQKARAKRANTLVIADEISFYASSSLSAQLATMAGFGVRYILQLQDIGQLPQELKAPILTNCSVKLFYKISDKETLEFVEKLGGEELVTELTKRVDSGETALKVSKEPLLNATRIRAMWHKRQAILISEYLWTALFVKTAPVQTTKKFDWTKANAIKREVTHKIYKRENRLYMENEIDGSADDGVVEL